MSKIKDLFSLAAVGIVCILTVIILFAIWDIIQDEDIIMKALATGGIFLGASLVTIVATYVLSIDKSGEYQAEERLVSSDFFTHLRRNSLLSLITFVVALAFLGVLSIWDILQEEVVGKSFASAIVLIFSVLLVVIITLGRDGKDVHIFRDKENKVSTARVVLAVLLFIFVVPWLLAFTIGMVVEAL